MELFEHKTKKHMTREEAAAVLRDIADSLARHNDLEFDRDGKRYVVAVADTVEMEVEIEVGSENSLEIEIAW